MTPKYRPILWWRPKNIHKIFIPPKKFFFENPKTYWNSKFWTEKKYDPSVRMYKKFRVSPPPPPMGRGRTEMALWMLQLPKIYMWIPVVLSLSYLYHYCLIVACPLYHYLIPLLFNSCLSIVSLSYSYHYCLIVACPLYHYLIYTIIV